MKTQVSRLHTDELNTNFRTTIFVCQQLGAIEDHLCISICSPYMCRSPSVFQAETAEGETWDSSALHATLQRYPRKEYCHLVRATLETMRTREAQSKRDEARLADIYKQVQLVWETARTVIFPVHISSVALQNSHELFVRQAGYMKPRALRRATGPVDPCARSRGKSGFCHRPIARFVFYRYITPTSQCRPL